MYIFFLKKCFKKSLTQAYPPDGKANLIEIWHKKCYPPNSVCDSVILSATRHKLSRQLAMDWGKKCYSCDWSKSRSNCFDYLCPLGKALLAKKRHNSLHRCSKKFNPFYLASPEIIEVKVCHRQVFDRVSGWIYFLCVNLLPPYLLRLQGDIQN